ncbi:methionyl-tRNA formyltransferase [Flavobacterium sp. CYK-4]|uniref:methionyl-tRNA formyltransferase n=1 Tax=Flavobacterium lotistagni TaxID=2709660 RepID=UPI00140A9A33|nr:methionyl-tRNA formyltransferase [Flavobacterium lotistagni]NHM06455.1 methionyl-tRNA formyltransferase [Flavobacterium lotistagni]
MKLGVLVSGNLGKIVLKHLYARHEIDFVCTDSKSDSIIEFCQANQIAVFAGNPRNGKAKDFYHDKAIEVLVSVNYLFLIEEDLIAHPSILAFNIHGSLLPKYRGRTPHVWAIINNETQTGITAHLIDSGCDTGDIIEQVIVNIGPKDTGAMILQKYNEQYIPLIDQVLSDIENNTLKTKKQNNAEATYFGKRSPEDGAIDWNWQKERIYNWVRAQADPYPGAFSQLNGQKITIDAIQFSPLGFDWEMPNGLVLSVNPLAIKTPNGVVEITKYRTFDFEITVGSILV